MNARSHRARVLALVLVLSLAAPTALFARYNPKPGFNVFSVEQDVELGKQHSAEIEKQVPVLNDAEVTRYIQRLGQRLAARAPGPEYPYTFKVVNQKEINAFALPGGPIYVNVGTIQAARNEEELAGVIGHEIGHVVMRHSTNQASKQILAQAPLALIGGKLGGGALGQLAQLGIGFGVGSVFLKYSRDAERQADLVGAGLLHDAGYNPQGMVTFFEKLAQQSGRGGTEFFSSHPNPGNRAEAVGKEVSTLGRRTYQSDSAEFRAIKQKVAGLKPLSAQEAEQQAKAGAQQGGTVQRSASVMPSGNFVTAEASGITIQRPENWESKPYGQSGGALIAPEAGVAGSSIAYGAIVDRFQSQAGLEDATSQLVQGIVQSNPGMQQIGEAENFSLNGRNARSVVLQGNSPVQGEKERDWLVTTQDAGGNYLYLVFVSPESDFKNLQPTFEKMLRSIQLP
jgi:Zn-dependent protease with chaperone function